MATLEPLLALKSALETLLALKTLALESTLKTLLASGVVESGSQAVAIECSLKSIVERFNTVTNSLADSHQWRPVVLLVGTTLSLPFAKGDAAAAAVRVHPALTRATIGPRNSTIGTNTVHKRLPFKSIATWRKNCAAVGDFVCVVVKPSDGF